MKNLFLCLLALFCSFTFQCCDDDEPIHKTDDKTNQEIYPSIGDIMATTTYSDFTVTFRVKSVKMPNTVLKYSRETSSTASPSLNKTSKPHLIKEVEVKSGGYSYYYFQAAHTGFNGGNRIYYQISATNSKGSDTSDIRSCIIKRLP